MTKDEISALIDVEWPMVVADADFDLDEVKLWKCDGYKPDGPRAIYFDPVLKPEDKHGFFTAEQLEEACSDEHWEKHRMCIFIDAPFEPEAATQALLGALLRHEFEHARQHRDADHAALDIDSCLVMPVLIAVAKDLPGGNAYYNFKPMEMDANAASAMYLRAEHPDHVNAILNSGEAQLARVNTPPEDSATLLTRTVAFLYLFRDTAERTMPLAVDKHLDAYSKRAGAIWRELETSAASGPAGQ